MTPRYYKDRFDPAYQVELEEKIAAIIFYDEAVEVHEEDAGRLGRQILREIVRELKPELLEALAHEVADRFDQHRDALKLWHDEIVEIVDHTTLRIYCRGNDTWLTFTAAEVDDAITDSIDAGDSLWTHLEESNEG